MGYNIKFSIHRNPKKDADKWLRRLSTGDDAILIKHKIGNATFYNLRKQP